MRSSIYHTCMTLEVTESSRTFSSYSMLTTFLFHIRPNQWFLCSPRLKYFLILNTFREVKIIHEFSLEQLNSNWNSGETLEIIGKYFTLVQSLVWCRQSDDKLKMYPKQFFKTMAAISSYILNKKDIKNSLTLISIHNCSSETVYFEERLSK